MTPWDCTNCGATVKAGVVCTLCGSELCPRCDGERVTTYFDGEDEHIGPCGECESLGVIPVDWMEEAA